MPPQSRLSPDLATSHACANHRTCPPSPLCLPRTHGPSPLPSLVPYPSSCCVCVTSTRPSANPNPHPDPITTRQLRDEYHAQLFTQARHGTLTLPPAPWLYKVTLSLPLPLTPTVHTL